MNRLSWNATTLLLYVFACLALASLFASSVYANANAEISTERSTEAPGVIAFDELTSAQSSAIRSLEILTTVWFFVVGSCVGSFLNVVVYRLPLGISLSKPKSRCPACETPIRRWDNLPLIGWLRLRGRCRDCNVAISPRYPLVEVGVGLIFLILLHIELLSGGANLPGRPPNHYAGVLWIIWYTKWDLIGLYTFHCGLMCVLVAATLIEMDGQTIPQRPLRSCLLICLILPTIWPTLHPVSFISPNLDRLDQWQWRWTVRDTVFSPGWELSIGVSLRGFLDGLVGLVMGVAIIGLVAVVTPKSTDDDPSHTTLMALGGLIGVILGWQAVVSVILVSSILRALQTLLFRKANWSACLMVGALVQISLGRILSEVAYWPSHQSDWFIHAGALFTILVLSRIRTTHPVRDHHEPTNSS